MIIFFGITKAIKFLTLVSMQIKTRKVRWKIRVIWSWKWGQPNDRQLELLEQKFAHRAMLSRTPIGSGNRGLWGGIATWIENRRMVGLMQRVKGSLVVTQACSESVFSGRKTQRSEWRRCKPKPFRHATNTSFRKLLPKNPKGDEGFNEWTA